MTLTDFIVQNNGKFVDFDGTNGYQCVDIVKAWEANLGMPIVSGNAQDVPYNYPTDKYEWVTNRMGNKPEPGDIVVFNFKPFGHIAICVNADFINLTCFEQNNPVGSPCVIKKHYFYRGVIGWLKPFLEEAIVNRNQVIDLLSAAYAEIWRFTHGGKEPSLDSIKQDAADVVDGKTTFADLDAKWRGGN